MTREQLGNALKDHLVDPKRKYGGLPTELFDELLAHLVPEGFAWPSDRIVLLAEPWPVSGLPWLAFYGYDEWIFRMQELGEPPDSPFMENLKKYRTLAELDPSKAFLLATWMKDSVHTGAIIPIEYLLYAALLPGLASTFWLVRDFDGGLTGAMGCQHVQERFPEIYADVIDGGREGLCILFIRWGKQKVMQIPWEQVRAQVLVPVSKSQGAVIV